MSALNPARRSPNDRAVDHVIDLETTVDPKVEQRGLAAFVVLFAAVIL